MSTARRKRNGRFAFRTDHWRGAKQRHSLHSGTLLRLEPLEHRQLLSVNSWGTAEGNEYNDTYSDAAYSPDGGSLYALSVIQESENGTYTTNLSGYAVGGQALFPSIPILNGVGNVQRLQVADNGDIFVAGQYQAGASAAGQALPAFGGNDIVVARFSMASGSPTLEWMEAFGSAEDDQVAAIQLVDNGSGNPSVCLVGNFGQELTLWNKTSLPNTSGADYGTFAVVVAADGALQYATELNDSGAISINDAAVTGTGELYVVGSFRGRSVQIGDDSFSEHQRISQAIIAKYQMGEGTIEPLWAHQIADSEVRSFARSVVLGPDGTVFVAGNYTDVTDFGIKTLPLSSVNPWAYFRDGFIAQVAESTMGQPENVWVRQLAGGDVLVHDLYFAEDTMYVACGFDREVDLDLGAGNRGDLVGRGIGDVAVAELQLEIEAGRVVGDELGRVWQMEYTADDLPGLGMNRFPGEAMIDVGPDGRVAIATASSSKIALTPVGTMTTQGGHDGVLIDIAPDYPLIEVTTTKPVLGQSAAELTATARYPFVNTDLAWNWQLWQLDDAAGRIWVQDGIDPAQMTFINQLVLGNRYEAVITVTDTVGKTTEYPYQFDVGLDPPQNLTATVASRDTVTVTWDLPDTVAVGDGFVIEADCTTYNPFYWDLVGQVTVTAEDVDNGSMSVTVDMTQLVDRWHEGLRYRVRSYRGTPEAMDLLSPAAVVLVPEPGTEPPPAPSFSINDLEVTEGDSGTTTATFTVTRSGNLSGTDTVLFATSDGSATTVDNDYLPKAGTLIFDPEVATQQVTVTIVGDVAEEADETFYVDLTNAIGATITDGHAVATIIDDDAVSQLIDVYIADIRFESDRGGRDWRAVVEVLTVEGDNPVAGVTLQVDFAGTTYAVVTDSDGIARTGWRRNLKSGYYLADAYDLVLEGYEWDLPFSLLSEDDSDGDGKPDDLLTV